MSAKPQHHSLGLAMIAAMMNAEGYRIGSRLPHESKPKNSNKAKQKKQRLARKTTRRHKP